VRAQLPLASHRNPAFTHSGFFVLRTPLLSFNELLQWSDGLELPKVISNYSQSEDWREAWKKDTARLRVRLQDIVQRPPIQLAIFLASSVVTSKAANDGHFKTGQRK
jgi:hypothetical protein